MDEDTIPSATSIEARGLAVGYPGDRGPQTTVLDHVDLTIGQGEFLTILGPSGCGKSTLLRVVADLLPPLAGSITVLGGTPAEARVRRDVAFVFQDPTLLPWRTARENVELPLLVGPARQGKAPGGTADELLALVGLSGLSGRYPDQLSGGQRQRVAIARALLSNPKLLLMDEPFGALDEITRDRLNDELLAIWRRLGTTILFVTHSIMEAVYLGQRVLVLAASPGRVQDLVDLRPMKAAGPFARESAAAMTAMAGLRSLLAQAGTPN